MEQQHHMILIKTHPDGSQEWVCPECGRRFIMQWPPHHKLVILFPGNEQVVHQGALTPLARPAAQPRVVEAPDEILGETCITPLDDIYLAPFAEWIETQNLD